MYRFVVLFLILVSGCLGVGAEEKTQVEKPLIKEFKLLVVSSASAEVEVYDFARKTRIGVIPVGKNPRDILLSPDKKLAFVNNLDEGSITVIDLSKQKVAKTLEVGEKPWDMKISPDGKELYVSNYGESTVTIVDLDSLTIAKKINVGKGPMSMSFADEDRLVFVGNSLSNDVSVIETASLRVIANVPVGPRPEHVVSNGDYVFVNNQGDNTVTVLHVALLDKPVDTFSAEEIADCGPMVSEQDYTYTTLPEEDLVLKLWTEDMSLEGKIPVGDKPYQFVFSPDYRLGFVTNTGSNDVSVIDLESSRVVETMEVGEKPMGIAVFY